jgi:iron complex transport system ATP-binding protein
VVGPNGAGKTTLLRLLAGLLPPTEGEIEIGGRPFGELSRRRVARSIAYVPQIRPARVPLSVEQVVLLGRYPHLDRLQLAPSREDYRAVGRALEEVDIEAIRYRPLDELSGGERQAVYIAAALAQEAELLLLDEPTTHLDPRHQREIVELLHRLHGRGGRTVVAATHDLNLAAVTADRVLALRQGLALACGPPRDILDAGVLQELFEAPFEVLERGGRRLALLDMSGGQS